LLIYQCKQKIKTDYFLKIKTQDKMKKIIYLSLLLAFISVGNIVAQTSASNHEHETEPPEPKEEIRMEKKHAKIHERKVQREKLRHAKHNLKMERYRQKHTPAITSGAVGYDGVAHKRRRK
jgi:hypothetical protein